MALSSPDLPPRVGRKTMVAAGRSMSFSRRRFPLSSAGSTAFTGFRVQRRLRERVVAHTREARLMRIAPVPQEMVLNYLAEHVLGLPRSY